MTSDDGGYEPLWVTWSKPGDADTGIIDPPFLVNAFFYYFLDARKQVSSAVGRAPTDAVALVAQSVALVRQLAHRQLATEEPTEEDIDALVQSAMCPELYPSATTITECRVQIFTTTARFFLWRRMIVNGQTIVFTIPQAIRRNVTTWSNYDTTLSDLLVRLLPPSPASAIVTTFSPRALFIIVNFFYFVMDMSFTNGRLRDFFVDPPDNNRKLIQVNQLHLRTMRQAEKNLPGLLRRLFASVDYIDSDPPQITTFPKTLAYVAMVHNILLKRPFAHLQQMGRDLVGDLRNGRFASYVATKKFDVDANGQLLNTGATFDVVMTLFVDQL